MNVLASEHSIIFIFQNRLNHQSTVLCTTKQVPWRLTAFLDPMVVCLNTFFLRSEVLSGILDLFKHDKSFKLLKAIRHLVGKYLRFIRREIHNPFSSCMIQCQELTIRYQSTQKTSKEEVNQFCQKTSEQWNPSVASSAVMVSF